jgi:hypothetical protein
MKDLGYANGWVVVPQIVGECITKGHERKTIKDPNYRNVTIIKCEECDYSYRIDSSG